jgi:hypothetical protein
MSKHVFKIQNIKTGEYSSGGLYPMWEKNGQYYNSFGTVKGYLNRFNFNTGDSGKMDYKKTIYADLESWKIVRYDLSELISCTGAEFKKELN